MKNVVSKYLSTENGDFWSFNSYFFFTILLNNIFHYVIYLVNTDAIFTLNNINFE